LFLIIKKKHMSIKLDAPKASLSGKALEEKTCGGAALLGGWDDCSKSAPLEGSGAPFGAWRLQPNPVGSTALIFLP
jgi:hypothetical protein